MMTIIRNITKYVQKAELSGGYKEKEFESILSYIKESYHLDYLSYESGAEDWAVISSQSGRLCMLHAKLKLIFSNFTEMDVSFLSVKATVLYFENYADKIWSIDSEYLKNTDSKLCWHTKEIDPACFSTQELYYATI